MALEKKVRPESLDYLLAAIAPIFIIGMIGSLVFFLITVCYQGSYTERLMWILGLYTVAAVLIARIAIEQSRQLSFAYMFALATATLFVTPQFFVVSGAMSVLSLPILVGLLVMVGVLADRITFDCTSMNERVQSTGIGLLQSLGLVKSNRRKSEPKAIAISAISPAKKPSEKRKHNPGVWVLYFALVALPLFGLGQLVIRSESDRRWAFVCLFMYLLSSLFLLVLISLLSLRKYLRERGVPMESSFAVRWLAIGMTSVFAVLCVLSLLPIPGQSFLSMDLPFRITNRDDLKANRWGWGREGAAGEGPQKGNELANDQRVPNQKQNQENDVRQGDGQPADSKDPADNKDGNREGKGESEGGKQSGDNKKVSEGKPSNSGKQSEGEKNKNQENGSRKDSESDKHPPDEKNGQDKTEKPNQEDRERQPPQAKDRGEQPKPNQGPEQEEQQERAQDEQNVKQEQQHPPPAPTRSIQWNFSAALRWLVFLVLLIVLIVFGIKYRTEVIAAIKGFGLWLGALFAGKKKALHSTDQVDEGEATIDDLYPPFHTFADPFSAGNGWSREKMVRHMYRAVLSWGYEHKVVRRDDETPEEFMRRLARRFPEQQERLSRFGILYNRIAYARATIAETEIKPMVELWKWLSNSTALRSVTWQSKNILN